MEQKPRFIDHTINIAMSQGALPSVLVTLQNDLEELGIYLFDVEVGNWLNAGVASNPSSNIRAIVQPRQDDFDSAVSAGFKQVRVDYTIQSGQEVLPERILLTAALYRSEGIRTTLHIANASSFESQVVLKLAEQVKQAGFYSLSCGDDANRLDPFSTARNMEQLSQTKIQLEFVPSNSYGMATANALAALRNGINHIGVAVGGVGGYSAIEEVLLGAMKFLGVPTALPPKLAYCCRAILKILGQDISPVKAVIGSTVFSHESGIHVDGILKRPDLYEAFSPEVVGLTRILVVGKHSGTAAIKEWASQQGFFLEDETAVRLLASIRKLANDQKRALTDDQIRELYAGLAVRQQ